MGNIFDEAWQSPFTKKYFIDGIAYDRPIIDAREDNVVTSVKKIHPGVFVGNAKIFLAPVDWDGTISDLKESFATFDGMFHKPSEYFNVDDISLKIRDKKVFEAYFNSTEEDYKGWSTDL